MSSLQKIAVIAGVLLSLLAGMNGFARGEPAPSTAKQLYDEGRKSYNLGRYEEALRNFEKAYQIKDDPAFLFNIAQCQRALQRYHEAERSYRAYLRENTSIGDNTRQQVQQLIAEMGKAVADERAKQALTGTEPPAPTAAPPSAAVQPAAPIQPRAPASQPAPMVHNHRSRLLWGGVIASAIGVGALVGGIVCGVLAKNAADKLTQLDQSKQPFNYNQEQTGKADELAAGVLLGIGGAAVIAGGTLVILGIRERRPARFSIAPTLSRAVAGASLIGTF